MLINLINFLEVKILKKRHKKKKKMGSLFHYLSNSYRYFVSDGNSCKGDNC